MRTLSLAVLSLLAIGSVQAETSSVEQELIQRGMTEAQPGLYRANEKGIERFVALTSEAQMALAERITQRAEHVQAQLGKNGLTKNEQQFIDGLLKSAEQIRGDASKTPWDYRSNDGSCSTGALVRATGFSQWGNESYATAGVTLDAGPTTPTSNYAFAGNETAPGNYSYTVGSNLAVAYSFSGYGCYGAGIAHVTCPTGGSGASAAAFSTHPGAPNFCYAP